MAVALRREDIMTTDTRWLKAWVGVLLLAALVAAVTSGAMMGTGTMGPAMMWGYGSSGAIGAWGMTLGMLAMLAFWIALIAGVVLLVRWAVSQPPVATASTASDEPLAILKRRYAAGEVDQPTYERMKAELAA
jgi:putative membrane protein